VAQPVSLEAARVATPPGGVWSSWFGMLAARYPWEEQVMLLAIDPITSGWLVLFYAAAIVAFLCAVAAVISRQSWAVAGVALGMLFANAPSLWNALAAATR
jgi:hypothetical protein